MEKKVNDLSSNNIKSLVLRYSFPAILALLIQSLYNIIDTIYVGHGIGGLGIAAMTIVYPIQLIMLALTNLFAIGGGALISIQMGEENLEKANKIAGNVVLSLFITGSIMTVFCLIYLKPILFAFGASHEVYPLTRDYMVIAFACTNITFLAQGFFPLLRAEGKLKVVMFTTVLSVIINIILAPLFLFYFNFGMWGVSIATQISKLFILIYIVWYYYKGKTVIQFKARCFIPELKIIINSALLGLSSFLRAGGAAITNFIINYIALKYGGSEGLAAFGLAYRISIFLFMPIMGLIQGTQPIIGYNYGADRRHNIKKTLDFSMLISIILTFIFIVLIVVFAKEITLIFGKDPIIIKNTPGYLIWLTLPLPVIAYQFIISGYFQSVGKVFESNMATILRQYICFIPLMLILSYFYHMTGLTASYLISNIISFIVLFLWMQKEKKTAFIDT